MVDGVLAFTKVARAELELQEVSVDSVVSDIIQGSAELQAPAAQLRIQGPLGRVQPASGSMASSLSRAISILERMAVETIAQRGRKDRR